MPVVIQDDVIRVNINEHGAQPTSLFNKKNGLEYIWPADEKYWLWHAPVLFPIEGKLKDSFCLINGEKYYIGQHGFARDQDFTVISKNKNSVVLRLDYSEDSLKIYPYKFRFEINYQVDQGKLKTKYQIINLDTQDIYFTVGSHPGFNLPLTNDTTYEDYYLHLSSSYEHIPLDKNGLVDIHNKQQGGEQNIALNRELFKNDALIFEFSNPSPQIEVRNHINKHGLRLSSDNAKYWGVWSCYPKEGKFICIEPWWGITDVVGTDQNFTHKFGNNKLKESETFTAAYEIEVF